MSAARVECESPLEGVSDEGWRAFVKALDVQPVGAVSASGGIGSYDLRPRRLVEIGVATRLRSKRTPAGRLIYECDIKPPLTLAKLRASALTQYSVLMRSISLYHRDVVSGVFQLVPGLSLAGALAILHRGGRGALGAWPQLFEDTRRLYDAAREAF